jgi:hypothetical protein
MANETEKEFLKELKALFEKYAITIDDYDNYDGDENYCGTEFVLHGKDNIIVNLKDLDSALTKAV